MFSLFDSPYTFDPFYIPFYARRSFFPRRRRVIRPSYYIFDLFNDFSDNDESQEIRHEKESPKKEANEESPKTEPQEKNEESHVSQKKEDRPRNFSFQTRSFITRNNGVEHIRKEVVDSQNGISSVYETRKIGNRSMTIKTEKDTEGNVHEEQILENMTEEEIEAFKNEWLEKTDKKQLENHNQNKEMPQIE